MAVATGTRAVYHCGMDHLDDELRHLDLLLRRAVARLDEELAAAQSHQGIYISRDEVDRLLTRCHDPAPVPGSGFGPREAEIEASRERIDATVAATRDAGIGLPLPRLADRLVLSPAETQILVACLAPELDHGYDRIYAYIQDDLARRRPSVDLVTALISDHRHEQWHWLHLLSPQAPLLNHGVLRVVPDPASPSGSSALSRLLQIAPAAVAHLLGRAELDPVLAASARIVRPVHSGVHRPSASDASEGACQAGELGHLIRIAERAGPRDRGLLIQVHGAPGAGQADLARAVPAALGSPHVEVSCPALPGGQRAEAVMTALRDAWIAGLPVVLLDADGLVQPEDGTTREQILGAALNRFPVLVLLTGGRPWPLDAEPAGCDVHRVHLVPPARADQEVLWRAAIHSTGLHVEADGGDEFVAGLASQLAGQVRLGPGQITGVAREVGDDALAHHPARADRQAWLTAARARATQRLDGLARRVPTTRGWADLVLEGDRINVLREICAQVRLRDVVLGEWGMAARTGVARGLSVLFAGPPGTGKTMSAGVIAHELGRELFAIDLSQVVSKYIGETEKNLARVFESAEDSGAVLLFDEADALFGARTEISDAHDRYANIETSYLLQRMEEYDGIAVLSTNLRQNMDDAFLRRLRFLVDFPLPDAAKREEIWARHLGGDVPVADDVELALLAARLQISGGSIRNIALAAAFLAASDDSPVRMDHLNRAARREFEKLGKLWRDPTAGTSRAPSGADRHRRPAAGAGPCAGTGSVAGQGVAS